MYELIGQMLGVAPEQLKAVAETITIIAGAILAVTGGRALSGIVKRIVDILCEMLERVSATLERMEMTMGQLSSRYQDVKDALEKHDRRVDTVNVHTDEAVKPAVEADARTVHEPVQGYGQSAAGIVGGIGLIRDKTRWVRLTGSASPTTKPARKAAHL